MDLGLHGGKYPTDDAIIGENVSLIKLKYVSFHQVLGLWERINHSDEIFDWLPYGPFTQEEFMFWYFNFESKNNTHTYGIISSDNCVGLISYMEIKDTFGSIEIGHVLFTKFMQQSVVGTEVIYLLLKNAFETLGYRRVEWKTDSNNLKSQRAATRFGFTQEGIFRQHRIVKGRNRDTVWYSLLDREWTNRKQAFLCWLDKSNFREDGSQIGRLTDFREREEGGGEEREGES